MRKGEDEKRRWDLAVSNAVDDFGESGRAQEFRMLGRDLGRDVERCDAQLVLLVVQAREEGIWKESNKKELKE